MDKWRKMQRFCIERFRKCSMNVAHCFGYRFKAVTGESGHIILLLLVKGIFVTTITDGSHIIAK